MGEFGIQFLLCQSFAVYMSEKDLIATCEHALAAYKKLLPPNIDPEDWQSLLPLDVIFVARSEQEFSEFKANWEVFLERLDQIWNHANAFARHHISNEETRKRIIGLLGNINQKRTTDELLAYFDKARNSAHHTLWRHIHSSDYQEIITDAKGVSIDLKSNVLSIKGQAGGTVSELVVLNEGVVLLKEVLVVEKKVEKTYFLPETHKGNLLYPLDRVLPQILGKMALSFYLTQIDAIRKNAL